MSSRFKSPVSQALGRFRAHVRHAFAMPSEDEALSVEELALLDRMADAVVRRRMAAPATLFLESAAPLNFLGSQALYLLTPLLNLACDASDFERAARLLEHRGVLARLVALIEAKSRVTAP